MTKSTYTEIYNSFFKDIVELPDGSLNKDQVMRELSDYTVLLESVSKVYCAITNGKISKPNTLPEVVISVYEDCMLSDYEEWLKDEAN